MAARDIIHGNGRNPGDKGSGYRRPGSRCASLYKAEKSPPILLFTSAQFSNFIVSLVAAIATSVQEGHPDLWGFWMNINSAFGLLSATFFLHFSYSYLNKNKLFPNKLILLAYTAPLGSFFVRPLFYYHNVILSDRSAFGLYDVVSNDLNTLQFALYYSTGMSSGLRLFY